MDRNTERIAIPMDVPGKTQQPESRAEHSRRVGRLGGRPKGSKTKRKLTRRADRMAAALGGGIKSVKPRACSRESPLEALAGISPLDLLLTSMRNAWETAYRLAAAAELLEKDAAILRTRTDAEAIRKVLWLDEKAPYSVAEVNDKTAELEKRATDLRIQAGVHLSTAQGLAKDVAPYVHPKLANTDSRISGELTIVQRKFAVSEEKSNTR